LKEIECWTNLSSDEQIPRKDYVQPNRTIIEKKKELSHPPKQKKELTFINDPGYHVNNLINGTKLMYIILLINIFVILIIFVE
jgi:hypothetical protein